MLGDRQRTTEGGRIVTGLKEKRRGKIAPDARITGRRVRSVLEQCGGFAGVIDEKMSDAHGVEPLRRAIIANLTENGTSRASRQQLFRRERLVFPVYVAQAVQA